MYDLANYPFNHKALDLVRYLLSTFLPNNGLDCQ
jgi:hypothetical protein